MSVLIHASDGSVMQCHWRGKGRVSFREMHILRIQEKKVKIFYITKKLVPLLLLCFPGKQGFCEPLDESIFLLALTIIFVGNSHKVRGDTAKRF
jgi:hypothetical protein